MSQRTKTIEIDGQKYTVYELTVKQIRQVIEEIDQLSGDRALEVLAMCSDVTLEAMDDMAPSNIRQLWDAWSEVNRDFLHLVRQAMKRPPVQKMIDDLLSRVLTDASAALSSAGMALDAGNTDGDFSGQQSGAQMNLTGSENWTESIS